MTALAIFADAVRWWGAISSVVTLAEIVLVVRVCIAVLAVPIIVISVCGFIRAGRGSPRLADAIYALAFLNAVGNGAFQFNYFILGVAGAPPSGWGLFALTSVVVSLGFALLSIMRLRKMPMDIFDKFRAHMDVAMAMIDLARVNPSSAMMMADDCRRLTAKTVILRG